MLRLLSSRLWYLPMLLFPQQSWTILWNRCVHRLKILGGTYVHNIIEFCHDTRHRHDHSKILRRMRDIPLHYDIKLFISLVWHLVLLIFLGWDYMANCWFLLQLFCHSDHYSVCWKNTKRASQASFDAYICGYVDVHSPWGSVFHSIIRSFAHSDRSFRAIYISGGICT